MNEFGESAPPNSAPLFSRAHMKSASTSPAQTLIVRAGCNDPAIALVPDLHGTQPIDGECACTLADISTRKCTQG